MDIFQRAQNPWGQEVLVRISWDLFWVFLAVGFGFVVVHLLMRGRWKGEKPKAPAGAAAGVPQKVVRHGIVARLFHWVMALAMLVLLVTGFLPQVGIHFAWLKLHWIFGVVLIISIIFHMLHATFVLNWRDIWLSPTDVKEWWQAMRHDLGGGEPAPKPGKYPVDHKLYHHAVTVAGFAAMITGVLMMFRIDNPIFERNTYMYSDSTWGLIYVLHGLGGVGLVALTVTHIYFAILPEKRFITRSMIKGWISKDEFAAHHDPKRWDVGGDGGGDSADAPAAAPASEQV